jgi:hypothetical protein
MLGMFRQNNPSPEIHNIISIHNSGFILKTLTIFRTIN